MVTDCILYSTGGYADVSEELYWTGLHYDGWLLTWDGELPTDPALRLQACEEYVQ